MKMVRHYFIGSSLDDLESLQQRLESTGVSAPQIHVLSNDEAGVWKHAHLHEVQSLMRSDVVHSTTRGAIFGLIAAALLLAVAYLMGWTRTAAGWMPFVFLAVVVLGFLTWEGGLFGIQTPNHHFKRFEQALADGKHVFFVDLLPDQESNLEAAMKDFPQVSPVRIEAASTHWLVAVQQKLGMVRHS